MTIPNELKSLPPRNIDGAVKLFEPNQKKIKATKLALTIVPAVFLFLGIVFPLLTGWYITINKGELNTTSSILISLILDVFIGLFLFAFYTQDQRAKKLYVSGTAGSGKVSAVKSAGAGGGQTGYLFIEIKYEVSGRLYTGKLTTTGAKMPCKEGDELPILVMPESPEKFAVYHPELGMTPGIGKAA